MTWITVAEAARQLAVSSDFIYGEVRTGRLPRITFHDGRHSYNSALMHLGVDWRVSADQTGHSTAAMQKHYSHGSPASRRQAAATLQAGLDAVAPRTPDQTPDQTEAR